MKKNIFAFLLITFLSPAFAQLGEMQMALADTDTDATYEPTIFETMDLAFEDGEALNFPASTRLTLYGKCHTKNDKKDIKAKLVIVDSQITSFKYTPAKLHGKVINYKIINGEAVANDGDPLATKNNEYVSYAHVILEKSTTKGGKQLRCSYNKN